MAGYWVVRGSAIRDQAAADEYVKAMEFSRKAFDRDLSILEG